jgi:transcriptional regulator with XRE-family HTH domain
MASKNSTLGSLIRLVRRKNSWTLRQLSEKVGIPLSTLAKVETDKLSLTYDKLQQFTASLGVCSSEDPNLANELISLAAQEAESPA